MSTTCCPPGKPASAGTAPASAPASAPARPRRGLWRAMRRLGELARQRRALAEMEPHRLRDIGLDPEQARREAARPFWDAPEHWRRRS